MMKKINKKILLNATGVFVLVLIPSFIAAGTEDEGTMGTNITWVSFVHVFNILRFPTHTLFAPYILRGGFLAYVFGLLINCLFYGLLTERLFAFMKK